MKILQLSLCITFLALCCLLVSCDPCNSDYSFLDRNFYNFQILDRKTRQNILLIGSSDYNYDTVKVYNTDWTVPANMHVRNDGTVLFQFVTNSDVGKVNQVITRRFYMYFNHSDVDTIDIGFNTSFDKCHDQMLKYFKVSYNDSVYYDASTDRPPGQIQFLK